MTELQHWNDKLAELHEPKVVPTKESPHCTHNHVFAYLMKYAKIDFQKRTFTMQCRHGEEITEQTISVFLPALWEWADKHIARMGEVIGGLIRQADADGIPLAYATIPYEWRQFKMSHILGVRLSYEKDAFMAFSYLQYGRFYCAEDPGAVTEPKET